jgi:hypothetical protein
MPKSMNHIVAANQSQDCVISEEGSRAVARRSWGNEEERLFFWWEVKNHTAAQQSDLDTSILAKAGLSGAKYPWKGTSFTFMKHIVDVAKVRCRQQ